MTAAPLSARFAAARAAAVERQEAQARWLRGLGFVLIAVVTATTVDGDPAPGSGGRGVLVLIALVAFVASVLAVYAEAPLVLLAALCLAGALLSGLQTSGAGDVAPTAAVFIAVSRRPDRAGIALGTGTAALAALLAGTVRDVGADTLAGNALLAVLVGILGLLMARSRATTDRVELLLAELQDAREAEAQAAAAAERARIAGDLHDVLAHSLSGAAIQLEAARQLVRREEVAPPLAEAVERAAGLVRGGLDDARDAVGALRGRAPGLDDVPALVDRVRADLRIDVTLDHRPASVGPQAGLALYRGVQEALTNAARHAPQAAVSVVVDGRRVTVENALGSGPPSPGGGHGLDGLRERLVNAGGTAEGGAQDGVWRVVLEVPA